MKRERWKRVVVREEVAGGDRREILVGLRSYSCGCADLNTACQQYYRVSA